MSAGELLGRHNDVRGRALRLTSTADRRDDGIRLAGDFRNSTLLHQPLRAARDSVRPPRNTAMSNPHFHRPHSRRVQGSNGAGRATPLQPIRRQDWAGLSPQDILARYRIGHTPPAQVLAVLFKLFNTLHSTPNARCQTVTSRAWASAMTKGTTTRWSRL